jgi:hypothetical protein
LQFIRKSPSLGVNHPFSIPCMNSHLLSHQGPAGSWVVVESVSRLQVASATSPGVRPREAALLSGFFIQPRETTNCEWTQTDTASVEALLIAFPPPTCKVWTPPPALCVWDAINVTKSGLCKWKHASRGGQGRERRKNSLQVTTHIFFYRCIITYQVSSPMWSPQIHVPWHSLALSTRNHHMQLHILHFLSPNVLRVNSAVCAFALQALLCDSFSCLRN